MGEVIYGKHSYGLPLIRRGLHNKIIIGEYCSIATGVIWDSGFSHNVNFVSTFPFKDSEHIVCRGDIVVGNDVWIGEDSLIMSGVNIGDGAVIGARAIVTKDVDPYSIVVGSPAKLVRYRFTEDQRKRLLEIKWWDWEESRVIANQHLLVSEDVDYFINNYV